MLIVNLFYKELPIPRLFIKCFEPIIHPSPRTFQCINGGGVPATLGRTDLKSHVVNECPTALVAVGQVILRIIPFVRIPFRNLNTSILNRQIHKKYNGKCFSFNSSIQYLKYGILKLLNLFLFYI